MGKSGDEGKEAENEELAAQGPLELQSNNDGQRKQKISNSNGIA